MLCELVLTLLIVINDCLLKLYETIMYLQGPLEHTVGQFWQMIWEQDSKAIIMLNRVIEKGAVCKLLTSI